MIIGRPDSGIKGQGVRDDARCISRKHAEVTWGRDMDHLLIKQMAQSALRVTTSGSGMSTRTAGVGTTVKVHHGDELCLWPQTSDYCFKVLRVKATETTGKPRLVPAVAVSPAPSALALPAPAAEPDKVESDGLPRDLTDVRLMWAERDGTVIEDDEGMWLVRFDDGEEDLLTRNKERARWPLSRSPYQ